MKDHGGASPAQPPHALLHRPGCLGEVAEVASGDVGHHGGELWADALLPIPVVHATGPASPVQVARRWHVVQLVDTPGGRRYGVDRAYPWCGHHGGRGVAAGGEGEPGAAAGVQLCKRCPHVAEHAVGTAELERAACAFHEGSHHRVAHGASHSSHGRGRGGGGRRGCRCRCGLGSLSSGSGGEGLRCLFGLLGRCLLFPGRRHVGAALGRRPLARSAHAPEVLAAAVLALAEASLVVLRGVAEIDRRSAVGALRVGAHECARGRCQALDVFAGLNRAEHCACAKVH